MGRSSMSPISPDILLSLKSAKHSEDGGPRPLRLEDPAAASLRQACLCLVLMGLGAQTLAPEEAVRQEQP